MFLHQSIYNTVAGSLPGEGWNGVNNEEAFKAVISKYPEIMLFNGHSHWEMDSKSNIFEGTSELPIHAFNCASVSYLWTGFNTITGQNLDGSQGYYVEVYGGTTIVRGRDFITSEWISAAQYLVESDYECNEHNMESISLTYENGYMSNGKMVLKCQSCGFEATKETDPVFTFLGYSVKEDDVFAICVGYNINKELLAAYEKLNNTKIAYGVVASVYDNLVDKNAPVNADGTASEVTKGSSIVAHMPSTVRSVTLRITSSSWTDYESLKLILAGFIIEKGTVSYICSNSLTSAPSTVTYSQLKSAS
jgi:hypothetical protein